MSVRQAILKQFDLEICEVFYFLNEVKKKEDALVDAITERYSKSLKNVLRKISRSNKFKFGLIFQRSQDALSLLCWMKSESWNHHKLYYTLISHILLIGAHERFLRNFIPLNFVVTCHDTSLTLRFDDDISLSRIALLLLRSHFKFSNNSSCAHHNWRLSCGLPLSLSFFRLCINHGINKCVKCALCLNDLKNDDARP